MYRPAATSALMKIKGNPAEFAGMRTCGGARER
jgi:hypothetical protein